MRLLKWGSFVTMAWGAFDNHGSHQYRSPTTHQYRSKPATTMSPNYHHTSHGNSDGYGKSHGYGNHENSGEAKKHGDNCNTKEWRAAMERWEKQQGEWKKAFHHWRREAYGNDMDGDHHDYNDHRDYTYDDYSDDHHDDRDGGFAGWFRKIGEMFDLDEMFMKFPKLLRVLSNFESTCDMLPMIVPENANMSTTFVVNHCKRTLQLSRNVSDLFEYAKHGMGNQMVADQVCDMTHPYFHHMVYDLDGEWHEKLQGPLYMIQTALDEGACQCGVKNALDYFVHDDVDLFDFAMCGMKLKNLFGKIAEMSEMSGLGHVMDSVMSAISNWDMEDEGESEDRFELPSDFMVPEKARGLLKFFIEDDGMVQEVFNKPADMIPVFAKMLHIKPRVMVKMMENADQVIRLYKMKLEAYGLEPNMIMEGAKRIAEEMEKKNVLLSDIVNLPMMMNDQDMHDYMWFIQTDNGTRDRPPGDEIFTDAQKWILREFGFDVVKFKRMFYKAMTRNGTGLAENIEIFRYWLDTMYNATHSEPISMENMMFLLLGADIVRDDFTGQDSGHEIYEPNLVQYIKDNMHTLLWRIDYIFKKHEQDDGRVVTTEDYSTTEYSTTTISTASTWNE